MRPDEEGQAVQNKRLQGEVGQVGDASNRQLSLSTLHAQCGEKDLSLNQDVRKLVLGRFPRKIIFYIINEAHKQYSLSDTIFNYIF
jgi:hypothetical protein